MSLIAKFTSGAPLRSADFVRAVEAKPALAREVDPATGNTPLHFACCGAAPLAVVAALLAAHAPAAGAADHDGNLPLMGAVANGADADVVRALLKAHPAGARARFAADEAVAAKAAKAAARREKRAAAALPDEGESAAAASSGASADARQTVLHSAACHHASPDTVCLCGVSVRTGDGGGALLLCHHASPRHGALTMMMIVWTRTRPRHAATRAPTRQD